MYTQRERECVCVCVHACVRSFSCYKIIVLKVHIKIIHAQCEGKILIKFALVATAFGLCEYYD